MLLLLGGVYTASQLPGSGENKVHVFLVRSGENYSQLAHRLEKEGIVRSERTFRWYVRWRSLFHPSGRLPLLRGEYALHPHMSLGMIVDHLKKR